MSAPPEIRPAEPRDAARITAIYNDGIAGRQATFETRLREVAEIEAWFEEPRPFLVSQRDGVVVGWARAARYSLRPVYDGVAEHAVYVDSSAHGQGHGRALLAALCETAKRAGIHKLTSRLFPENEASRAAHAATGFLEVGVHPRHARLDGQWRDTVVVERLLGEAAKDLPPALDILSARTLAQVRHRELLAACDALRDLVLDPAFLEAERARDMQPHERLMAAMFARSFTTFRAAVELARNGFGHQAAMLNRSLFEDMVDIHWVPTDPDKAVARIRDHHQHGRMLTADAARVSYPTGTLTIPTFDPAERARLDKMFGDFGQRPWTGLGLHRRVDLIEHMWGDKRDALRFVQRVVHRDNNQMLHSSAHGIGLVVAAHTEDVFILNLGPGGEHLDQALVATTWCFAQTLDLTLKAFELPGRERFDDVYTSIFPAE